MWLCLRGAAAYGCVCSGFVCCDAPATCDLLHSHLQPATYCIPLLLATVPCAQEGGGQRGEVGRREEGQGRRQAEGGREVQRYGNDGWYHEWYACYGMNASIRPVTLLPPPPLVPRTPHCIDVSICTRFPFRQHPHSFLASPTPASLLPSLPPSLPSVPPGLACRWLRCKCMIYAHGARLGGEKGADKGVRTSVRAMQEP